LYLQVVDLNLMGGLVAPSKARRDKATIVPRIGNGSLSEQATHALLEMILNRVFPNDRLPSEPELADQMSLSRTTVRAALQSLERLGVVSRVPGRGTQIRPQVDRSSLPLHRLIGFRGMLEARYDDVASQQRFYISDSASPAAMKALGISADVPALVNEKTYFADGSPAVYLVQEVPVDYLEPGLAEQLIDGTTTAPETLFELSRSWPSREIDNSVIELIPSIAGPAEKRALKLKPGTPYLELSETHYSERNEPVAFGREAVRDDFVRLRLVRTR